MRFFIDTANIEEIREATSIGIVDGVTTNPSLVAKEGLDMKDAIKEIASINKGPISAEVLAENAQDMIREGRELAKIAENVIIKVPMTLEGLKATKQFSLEGIGTNVTLVFSVNQALLAARAGAAYVSPFIGRLDDIDHDGIKLVKDIVKLFNIHDIKTKIIAASIRHPLHISDAALAGAHIATVPYKVLVDITKHPLTTAGIEKFASDWNKAILKK